MQVMHVLHCKRRIWLPSVQRCQGIKVWGWYFFLFFYFPFHLHPVMRKNFKCCIYLICWFTFGGSGRHLMWVWNHQHQGPSPHVCVVRELIWCRTQFSLSSSDTGDNCSREKWKHLFFVSIYFGLKKKMPQCPQQHMRSLSSPLNTWCMFLFFSWPMYRTCLLFGHVWTCNHVHPCDELAGWLSSQPASQNQSARIWEGSRPHWPRVCAHNAKFMHYTHTHTALLQRHAWDTAGYRLQESKLNLSNVL